MKIEDIFEDMRPVATVWKKRGDRVERGRVSRFVSNLKPLKKIEVDRDKEKEKSACSGSEESPGFSPKGGKVGA